MLMCVECELLRAEYDSTEKACRKTLSELHARRLFPTDYRELTVAAKQAWHDLETALVKFDIHRRRHPSTSTL
jgi:hypothetical protein